MGSQRSRVLLPALPNCALHLSPPPLFRLQQNCVSLNVQSGGKASVPGRLLYHSGLTHCSELLCISTDLWVESMSSMCKVLGSNLALQRIL